MFARQTLSVLTLFMAFLMLPFGRTDGSQKAPAPKNAAADQKKQLESAIRQQQAAIKLAVLQKKLFDEYLKHAKSQANVPELPKPPNEKPEPSDPPKKPGEEHPKGSATPPGQSNQDAQIAAAKKQREYQLSLQANDLVSASLSLSAAADSYGGYKARADGNVSEALLAVNPQALRSLGPREQANRAFNKSAVAKYVLTGLGGGYVQQIMSDSQLLNARMKLENLSQNLTQGKDYKNISGRVTVAIGEIDAALRQSAENQLKGRELDVLTAAYVLLATANADYNGHRAAAMNSVGSACNLLEKGLLSNGNLLSKIKALTDTNKGAGAAFVNGLAPQMRQPQIYSDVQLLMADSLIQRINTYLLINADATDGIFRQANQMDILGILNNADREIRFALVIN